MKERSAKREQWVARRGCRWSCRGIDRSIVKVEYHEEVRAKTAETDGEVREKRRERRYRNAAVPAARPRTVCFWGKTELHASDNRQLTKRPVDKLDFMVTAPIALNIHTTSGTGSHCR